MKKYSILIEETVSGNFEVLASDEKEAKSIAEEKYKSGEFILAPGQVTNRALAVIRGNEPTKWMEF